MIGVFDSWSGWLTFLAAMQARFPQYSYVYFGDYDNCPYGIKTPEEIQKLTIIGVQKLFDAGATIVILACNTASAWTLRKLQTEIFPDKRILGVTIPGAEKVVQLWLKKVTVFATHQTVNSRTYRERMGILDSTIFINEQGSPWELVQEIENLLPIKKCHSEADFKILLSLYSNNYWNCNSSEWIYLVQKYFSHFLPEEAIILWCTHYSYLRRPLENLFPESIIIDPSEESAEALWRYIEKHQLIISQGKNVIFL